VLLQLLKLRNERISEMTKKKMKLRIDLGGSIQQSKQIEDMLCDLLENKKILIFYLRMMMLTILIILPILFPVMVDISPPVVQFNFSICVLFLLLVELLLHL